MPYLAVWTPRRAREVVGRMGNGTRHMLEHAPVATIEKRAQGDSEGRLERASELARNKKMGTTVAYARLCVTWVIHTIYNQIHAHAAVMLYRALGASVASRSQYHAPFHQST